MPLSEFTATTTLNWLFRGVTDYTPSTDHTVKLHDGDPGPDGTANEIADSGYTEADYSGGWEAPEAFASPDGMVIENSATISFGTADGSFEVTHVSVWDQDTPENLLYKGALSGSVQFGIGNDIEFPIGNLKLGFEAETSE